MARGFGWDCETHVYFFGKGRVWKGLRALELYWMERKCGSNPDRPP